MLNYTIQIERSRDLQKGIALDFKKSILETYTAKLKVSTLLLACYWTIWLFPTLPSILCIPFGYYNSIWALHDMKTG
jgi:hypothetical protein